MARDDSPQHDVLAYAAQIAARAWQEAETPQPLVPASSWCAYRVTLALPPSLDDRQRERLEETVARTLPGVAVATTTTLGDAVTRISFRKPHLQV